MPPKTKLSLSRTKPARPTMLLATVGPWLALNFYFSDRYIQVIRAQSSWTERIIIVIIISWIILTSLYASFHLASLLFSLMVRRWGEKAIRDYTNTPPVAILYPCMNDMKVESIAACLVQDYPHYDLYILDDSTDSAERKRVDTLRDKYGKRVSIIRREKRNGFKAGNLNNALRVIGNQYKYVCVVDADELVPPTFLRDMVAIAEGDEQLGFVQASHHQYGTTEYGKQTGNAIDLHWSYFLPARNRFGFVYSYGHGVLFRIRALISVGGFPEVVSEDIALSAKLREAGYRGYFAYDIECLEETPPTYQAFRRRNQKIVSGTLEFFSRFYPSFLRAASIPLIEKFDLLITLSVIYLPIPFWGFLLVLYGIMPFLINGDVSVQHARNAMQVFGPLQGWDFLVFMFFTVFAPLCYLLPNAARSPRKVISYVLRMGAIYLSISLHTIGATVKWFVTRQAHFTPTGERLHESSRSATAYVECLLGLGMIVVGFLMGSLCLMAVGVSLGLVPILIKRNLDDRLTSLLTMFPIAMTIAAILGTPILLVGVTGIFAGVALAHH
jgi:cellulose synthase/poly-beta-1,6-N-acetylglucosamine synthase-like glycosyltransferase